MERIIQRRKSKRFFTQHFFQRLLERYGVILNEEELYEVQRQILDIEKGVITKEEQSFDVILKNRHVKFVAVLRNGRIVTAHSGKKMSPKKFRKKCSLGHIKKNL